MPYIVPERVIQCVFDILNTWPELREHQIRNALHTKLEDRPELNESEQLRVFNILQLMLAP